MATYGIEAIRHFGNARAHDVSTAVDLVYTFDRSDGFDAVLSASGHDKVFKRADQDCWELDLRDDDLHGGDAAGADGVDIFWIETHGNHEPDGQARLLFDTPHENWRTYSGTWQLGETRNAEWIMAFSCETATEPFALWNIFAGLHLFCGAYGTMLDGLVTEECGADVAAHLTDGDTVCDAWIYGVSDWSENNNHPIVIGPGTAETWNGGEIDWASSSLDIDHLPGHGPVSESLPPSRQACLLWRWVEG